MRVLIAGAGVMGRWHAHAVRRCGSAVAGVVDPDLSRAAALASGTRGAQHCASLEPALASLKPDVVHVCTPSGSHGPLIRSALAAGCHVLAEKPLAPTAEETRDLLAIAGAAGRLLVPVHQFSCQAGTLRLFDRLPTLGRLVHVRAACATAGAGPHQDPDALAADILPHFLDLTRRVLGVPLAEHAWTVARARPGEWRAAGSCGSVSVEYLVSNAARPTFNELQVLGERASARLDLFHGFVVFETGQVSRRAKATRPFALSGRTLVAAAGNLGLRALRREPAYPGLMELVRRAHLAMSGRGENPVPPGVALDVAETRDRLLAMAQAS